MIRVCLQVLIPKEMDEIIFWIKQSRNSRVDKLKTYQAEQIQIKISGCITFRQEADLGVLL